MIGHVGADLAHEPNMNVGAQPAVYGAPVTAPRAAHGQLDPSLRTIFDDLAEGVLVLDSSGQRVYSNPALNDLVGGNACLPLRTPEPPPYIPVDQKLRYVQALQGTSSLLTLDGSGATSTWLELSVPKNERVRARVTISVFGSAHGVRFAVWLLNPELPLYGRMSTDGYPTLAASAPPLGPGATDVPQSWVTVSAIGSLTRREKEVLQLLLEGQRVVSIARRLYLSPQTVRNHLKSIFHKLGAHSQAELLDRLRPAAPEWREPRPPEGPFGSSLLRST
jgi:DNA-binding CsgD family transcriptional regulator